jgi:hypothetical protein
LKIAERGAAEGQAMCIDAERQTHEGHRPLSLSRCRVACLHAPLLASTLSAMFIPVPGLFSRVLWLGEVLHWEAFAAVGLMMAAIASAP